MLEAELFSRAAPGVEVEDMLHGAVSLLPVLSLSMITYVGSSWSPHHLLILRGCTRRRRWVHQLHALPAAGRRKGVATAVTLVVGLER